MQQSTATVFMVRPIHFGYNEQTAASNAFQKKVNTDDMIKKVQQQFDQVVKLLRTHGIEVFVFEDRSDVITPDSVFPNNWISVNNSAIVLYPMQAVNRRMERREDIISFLAGKLQQAQVVDFTAFENKGMYLEGTGSIVADHINKVAYFALSPRTDLALINTWCTHFGYKANIFKAVDAAGIDIYHTNVMLAIGTGYAVFADAAIENTDQKLSVIKSLTDTGHELIYITNEQVKAFAGNMLEVKNSLGKKFLLMSETAYKSLSLSQIEKLKKYSELLVCFIPDIEETGGGSIRCMIGEVFN